MRLLFVNSSLTGGGSEKALLHVAQALVDRGHEVTMILTREKPQTYSIRPEIDLIQFNYSSKNKIKILFQRLAHLRNIIRLGDFDFVICFMWDLNIMTLMSSLGLGKKVIVSERAFPGAPTRRKTLKVLERISYRFAHKIIYQTEQAREYASSGTAAKSVVVPNIIENAQHGTVGVPRDRRIVSAGRLDHQKNFSLLLEAFAQFHSVNPEWSLEIFGQGPMEGELRKLASNLGVNHMVKFSGYVPDLATRMRRAGMFVLTSNYEGISNAMTEAMSLGIPTVCTDCPVGGAALMIDDGVSGLLVPVRGRAELVVAMQRLASDAELASRLSASAIQSVDRFSPGKMALIWEQEVFQ